MEGERQLVNRPFFPIANNRISTTAVMIAVSVFMFFCSITIVTILYPQKHHESAVHKPLSTPPSIKAPIVAAALKSSKPFFAKLVQAPKEELQKSQKIQKAKKGPGPQQAKEVGGDGNINSADVDVVVLKGKLMKGLGLSKLPDASKMNVSQEEYARMYKVYLNSIEESRRERQKWEDDVNEDTVQRFYSFTNTGHAIREHYVHHSKNGLIKSKRRTPALWLYFPVDIPEMHTHHYVEVDHANLRLFVSSRDMKRNNQKSDNTFDINVYLVLRSQQEAENDPDNQNHPRVLIDRRRIHLESCASKWTEFDVSTAAQSWISASDDNNFGLELECMQCTNRNVTLIGGDDQGSNGSLDAIINILTNVRKPSSRPKRSTDGGDPLSAGHRSRSMQCRKDGQRCCRHNMEVVFKDLEGFEFILQPKRFDAGYCKGRCPPRYNPAHHHAILQSLIWKKDRERAPKPCCAPNKLMELEILHLDEEDNTKLKVTKWKDIQVLECACS